MGSCFHGLGVRGQYGTIINNVFYSHGPHKAREGKISPQLLSALTCEGTGVKACLYRKVGEETWEMDPKKQEGGELEMQREKLEVMWPLRQRNSGASEDTKD